MSITSLQGIASERNTCSTDWKNIEHIWPVDLVITLKSCSEPNMQSTVSDVKHFRHQLELTCKQKFTPIMNDTVLLQK